MKLKILAAEDDKISRRLISDSKENKELLVAGTGIEAVDICRSNQTLINLDMHYWSVNGCKPHQHEAAHEKRKT
jgi:CheY-like chemotaxis protein